MPRFHFPFLAVLFAAGISVAEPARTIELIADPRFERGFTAKDRAGVMREIVWTAGTKPVWEVKQHDSRSRVTDPQFQQQPPGGFTFRDPFAHIMVPPQRDKADLILGVNAFREYDGKPRAFGDPWPHLFLEQRIGPPHGTLGDDSPSLSRLSRVDFSIHVRLLRDERHETPAYQSSIHAAQFLFFFTVQNLNRKSPGYGDYYWFAMPLYDDRPPVTAPLVLHDASSAKKAGTEKLIYSIGIKPFTDRIVAQGAWVEVRGDLLPHLRTGLEEAWKRGYLPASKNLDDYHLSSAVLGWEITGLNDAAMALKNLRCTAMLTPSSLDVER